MDFVCARCALLSDQLPRLPLEASMDRYARWKDRYMDLVASMVDRKADESGRDTDMQIDRWVGKLNG